MLATGAIPSRAFFLDVQFSPRQRYDRQEERFIMIARKWLYTISVMVILGVLGASSGRAAFDKRTMHLTFSGPVRLPGVVLLAGTYTFELAEPEANLDLVRVSSRNGRQVYFTGFTKLIDRPLNLPLNELVVFGEGAANAAPPITAWLSPDRNTGHQFIY